ncbi:unnamed protein product [Haemonchus placei]|uniref:Uncharacterized protein n=1 Tax=Haemonchus placei TaxID=6290 RepID=A0A3P7UHF3_HAEPC|nr:unnamed protein product [Haemonchus placei]
MANTANPTERKIVHVTHSTFAPLGLLALILLPPKPLLQNLWKQKQNCDELPSRIQKCGATYANTQVDSRYTSRPTVLVISSNIPSGSCPFITKFSSSKAVRQEAALIPFIIATNET